MVVIFFSNKTTSLRGKESWGRGPGPLILSAAAPSWEQVG